MKRDDGVTLIELLVCIAITGIVMSALTMSFFASTRSINDSSTRMADTHDSQMAATFFSSDMQSSNWVWTSTPPLGFQTCGAGGSIVTFAWLGSDSVGNELTKVATYRMVNQGGERQLVRYLCSGPPGLAISSTSTVVIAHNLNGNDPTVACFGSSITTTPMPSCDGQNVALAQLTAHAQANDADAPGFDYILRATRRPSPSSSPPPPPATPTWVQTTAPAVEVRSGMKTVVPFEQPNTAGNLIVAYVVWDNPGAVNVTDTNGNTYTRASPLPVSWGNGSAQVFYATDVAGGTNTVTATFATRLSSFGLLYISEYSGIDKTNPLDVTSSAIGTNSAMDSGPATTTNANDLLVGLGASKNVVTVAGAGYTSRSTRYDNIVEDRTVATAGPYRATATQSGPAWVMQLVAFRAGAGGSLP